MKQILTLSTFLTIGSLGSLHVFANTTPLVSVEHQNFSPGCGPVSYEIAPQPDYNDGNRNVRGESLRLFFSNFYLQADRPGDYLRTCDIDAKIIVPAGYRFMPVRAQAEGFYDIRPEGRNTGGVKVSYSVQPGDLHALRTNPNPFTGSGDIHCKADLENPKFTACFNRPTEVTLSTHLAMWLNHQVDGFSTIQLDASRRNQNLFWNWQLQSCENYFDQKQFHSSYVAYDGNTYSARISIDGYQGTYQSEAGFTGTLSNLTYSDDGLSISGNWSTSNAQGYFSFSILDVGEGRFHGIWGDDKGFRNDWTGQYVQEDVPQREYHSFFKADTGECLDSMGVFNSGAPLSMESCHQGYHQQFYTPQVDVLDGFHIKSRNSGKCVTGHKDQDGFYTVVQQACDQSDSAIWEFYHRGESPFKIKNTKTGLCMKKLTRGDLTLTDCDDKADFFYWSLYR